MGGSEFAACVGTTRARAAPIHSVQAGAWVAVKNISFPPRLGGAYEELAEPL
jgi:hypothetical protein